jgi:CheY-like chemotaxis protein
LSNKLLLAVIELGGYPDFRGLYEQLGYQVIIESSVRKALSLLKKKKFDVIVAEFNYQHTFRDRLSSLESIIAVAQTNEQLKFVVLYEKEFDNHLEKLRKQFKFTAEIAFPINEEKMRQVLSRF